mmetsp:Transcript_10907/g.16352  ORF Transcript_10907/g.16352 Transcript_10907/m.16352 type:complete len:694 (-) Transcript_10907:105-2186(-)
MSLTKNSCSTITTATAKDSIHRTPVKQEDELTACETPLSSPEFQSPIVTRKMKKEKDQQVTESKNQQEQPSLKDEDRQTSLGEAEAEVAKVSVDEDEDDTQDYSNWPMEGIKDPSKNDVLYGRGGGTNHHDGNKRYRKMVEGRKVDYVNSKRLDKPLVALDIIRQWRGQRPPGRFLKFDEKKEAWIDVGDKKAREKTSQALREKAPLLRKQQEEEMMELTENGSNIESSIASPVGSAMSETKNTRFNVSHEGVRPSKNIGRTQLRRDDSLGGHYVADNELSMKGFSWDDIEALPREENAADDPQNKQGWNPLLCESRPYSSSAEPANPLPFDDVRPVPPASRHWQQHPAHHPVASAHPAASAPLSDDRLQATWANRSYDEDQGQPYDDLRQTRSAEEAYRSNSYRGQDNRWGQGGSVRSPNEGYDHGSPYMNRWDGYHNGYHYPNPVDNRGPPPYNHLHHQWTSPNRYNPYHGQYQMPEHPPQSSPLSAEHSHPSQMGYDHSSYGHTDVPQNALPVQNSPLKRTGLDYGTCNESESSCSPSRSIPRPHPIKRDTSHQNETNDTKSQVKRLNRQRSIGSRRQVNEKDMYNLGRHLRQSSIGINEAPAYPLTRPENISEDNRTMTIDQADIATAIEGSSSPLDRPGVIKFEDRGNSLESIGLDDVHQLVFSSLNKPSALGDADRFNTFGTIGTES